MSYQLVMAIPPFMVTGCVGAVGKMNLMWGICEENISATSANLWCNDEVKKNSNA
jgi:hypothetical protein